MLRRRKTFIVLMLLAAALAALSLAQSRCPACGWAIRGEVREFARLKNRTALPQVEDFDGGVSLEEMLRGGDDRGRWSEAKAGAVEGYVVSVGEGGVEAANCYSLWRRDTHIHVAARADAPPREQFVVEVTPRLREWAAGRGEDWTTPALRRALVGRWCRFEGWLLFDREHADASENTRAEGEGVWRATAWELHPVTKIEVMNDE
jgi:hypothetical protein